MDLENNGGGGDAANNQQENGGGVELATAEPAANALGICEITVLCSLAVVLIPLGALILAGAFLSNHAELQSDLTIHFQSENDETTFVFEFEAALGVCAVALGCTAAACLARRLCCG